MIKKLEKKYKVLELEGIKKRALFKIKAFKKHLAREKFLNDPFYENKKVLQARMQHFERGGFFIEDLQEDIKHYEELSEFRELLDLDFFKKEIEKIEKKQSKIKKILAKQFNKGIQKNIKLNRKLLFQKWQNDLDLAYKEWEQKFEASNTKVFLDELETWLKKIQKVYETLQYANLGHGLLFDFDDGNLNEKDFQEILRWAEYIENNKNVKNLCDLLGRLKKASRLKYREMIKTQVEIQTSKKFFTSKNEISGLMLDNNIEYALPFELALLNDAENSLVFDKKFVERSLLCFDSKTITEVEREVIKYKEIEEEVEKSEEEKLGPMVLCVDTSGSMQGEPENIAKAVTLTIASKAKEQKRDCFLINFSTSIEVFDFSDDLGLKELVTFLKKSFNGGTDIAPALEFAVKKLQEEKYKNGDLLVISDFCMEDIGNELKEQIRLLKKQKNRFYSLVIGSYHKSINSIFDKEWIFKNNNISQIDEISDYF
ncbi:VWA domain-containing protein [Caminibacter sp.]